MKKAYILLLVPILLVLALWSAVGRVGWEMPIPVISAKHGYLMVSGLLGTLISLERTLILKEKWWLSIPVLSALSVMMVLAGQSVFGFSLQILSALLLCLLYAKQWVQYKEVFLLGLLLGAVSWMVSGAILLLGNGFPAASVWYILFLLFTIASERLELSKFIYTPVWAHNLLLALFALLILVQGIPFHWGSNHISGVLIAGVGFWLVQFDIVKINLKKDGFFFYTGSTLFAGYIWLILSGVLMAMPLASFYHYDAVLHSFFIGFVFSMLFAHAPVIFPALLKINERPFSKLFYIPVVLTHILLLIRLYADYSGNWELRKWIGLFQVLTFGIFFLMMAVKILEGIFKPVKKS